MRIERTIFILLIILWGAWTISLSSQGDIHNSQPTTGFGHMFNRDTIFVQSFSTDQRNLKSIGFFFSKSAGSNNLATVRLYLKKELNDEANVAVSALPVSPGYTGWLQFSFKPIPDSRGATYVAILVTDTQDDSLKIYSSLLDVFSENYMAVNGRVYPYDLSLIPYSSINLDNFAQNLTGSLHSLVFILLICLAMTLLGTALLGITGYPFTGTVLEWLVYALGCGLVFPGVVLYLASVFNIKSNLVLLVSILGLVMVAAVARFIIARKTIKKPYFTLKISPDEIVALVCFLLILIQRLVLLRGVQTPIWVDGMTHQKMINDFSIARFLPWDLNYPQGFHSIVDWINMLLGNSLPFATEMVGVLLSAVSGLALYELAKKCFGNLWIAASVVLLYVLVFPFPTYLLNWSRFPLFLGMVLLTITLSMLLERRKIPWILPVVFSTGIAVAHYGAFLMWLGVVGILILVSLVKFRQRKQDAWFYLSLLVIPFVFLVYRLAAMVLSGELGSVVAQNEAFLKKDDVDFLFQLVIKPGGVFLVATSLGGIIVGLVTRRKWVFLAVGWIAAEFLMYAVQIWILGVAVSNITNLVILAMIPLSIISGFFLEWICKGLPAWVGILTLVFISFCGVYFQLGLLTPKTNLFSKADLTAMDWIIANTRRGDVFWVGSLKFGAERIPSDGGGWITAYTGRQTVYEEECETPFDEFLQANPAEYFYFGGGMPGCYAERLWEIFNRCPLLFDQQNIKIIQRCDPEAT
jgi:hypothetical protein